MKVFIIDWKSQCEETSRHGKLYCIAKELLEAQKLAARHLSFWCGELYELTGWELLGASAVFATVGKDVLPGIVTEAKALELVNFKPRTLGDFIRRHPSTARAFLSPELKATLEGLIREDAKC